MHVWHAGGAPPGSVEAEVGDEEDEWILPEGVSPMLEEQELYSDTTAAGLALLWAPYPFNRRFGVTRRILDVPLVNNWFQEHVPSGCALRTSILYRTKHLLSSDNKG